MHPQAAKWCQRRVSKMLIRPPYSDVQEFPTVAKFRTKIPDFSQNIRYLTTSQGNKIYYVHFDYNYKKTILYSHSNGTSLLRVRFLDKLCQELKCNGIYYDYSGFGVSGAEYYHENEDELNCNSQIVLDDYLSQYRFRKEANGILNQLGFSGDDI